MLNESMILAGLGGEEEKSGDLTQSAQRSTEITEGKLISEGHSGEWCSQGADLKIGRYI